MNSNVTFALTSCGRLDLLRRTVFSFLRYNTYPLESFIIIEDSGDKSMIDEINKMAKEYNIPNFKLIFNAKKLGHIKSIDRMYSLIKTPYIFHCEDDWEFCDWGFIEPSMNILENNPKIIQAWIRDKTDHEHAFEEKIYSSPNPFDSTLGYQYLSTDWKGWAGFSFNPALRRLSDYLKIGPYDDLGIENAGHTEFEIGQIYKRMGYKAVTFNKGFCKHIGNGRHVQ